MSRHHFSKYWVIALPLLFMALVWLATEPAEAVPAFGDDCVACHGSVPGGGEQPAPEPEPGAPAGQSPTAAPGAELAGSRWVTTATGAIWGNFGGGQNLVPVQTSMGTTYWSRQVGKNTTLVPVVTSRGIIYIRP